MFVILDNYCLRVMCVCLGFYIYIVYCSQITYIHTQNKLKQFIIY
jgi:hypothetical protein